MDEYINILTLAISGRVRVPKMYLKMVTVAEEQFFIELMEREELWKHYFCSGKILVETSKFVITAVIKYASIDFASRFFELLGNFWSVTCTMVEYDENRVSAFLMYTNGVSCKCIQTFVMITGNMKMMDEKMLLLGFSKIPTPGKNTVHYELQNPPSSWCAEI